MTFIYLILYYGIYIIYIYIFKLPLVSSEVCVFWLYLDYIVQEY